MIYSCLHYSEEKVSGVERLWNRGPSFLWEVRGDFPVEEIFKVGFPCGSAGKESACTAGDLGLIPGLGRSPGEGKGYPFPVSRPGAFHGLYSSWGHKGSDTTETLSHAEYGGFPGGTCGKESSCQCRRWRTQELDPWVGRVLWRRKWQSIPVFLPGKSHRKRILGYSPWGCKDSDTTERLNNSNNNGWSNIASNFLPVSNV